MSDGRSRCQRQFVAGARRWALFSLLFLLEEPAAAQTILLQGGSSSLFDAHGGSLSVRGGTLTATLGAGRLGDDLSFGMAVKKTTRRVVFTAGDQVIDFQLPTDLFGGSRYVPVRGAGAEWTRGSSHVRLLAGSTSETLGAPFFRGAKWGRPLGLIFYDLQLDRRWRLFSNTALSRRRTSIHGLGWQPYSWLHLAAAGGIGSDKPYLGSSIALDRGWVTANVAYIQQEVGFRRIEVNSPMAVESVGENIALTFAPAPSWRINGAHQTFVDDNASSVGQRRVTVDQFGASANVASLRLIGTVYDSKGSRVDSLGTSVSVGRRISQSLDVVLDYFRSDSKDDRPATSAVLRLQETLGPRLSILQVVTRSAGQTSFNLGGEFLSNPLRLGISYQTVYAPLRENDPFVQAIGVDLRANLFGGMELQGGTYTTPDGRLRYTISTSYVRSGSDGGAASGRKPFVFERYVVRGMVQDVSEQPVAGAVIHLGSDVVMTDEAGKFFLRLKKANRIAVTVVSEEFIAPGRYEVVSAPATVTPAIDGRAPEVVKSFVAGEIRPQPFVRGIEHACP